MVFGHYISFKKSGSRYRALCPFHTEKTPSFYACRKWNVPLFRMWCWWRCHQVRHADGKNGFQRMHATVEHALRIPLKFTTGGERKEKEELLDLMRQTADFYHNLLTTHESGKEALDYLRKRGMTQDTIRRFRLGWAPDSWNALLEHFHKRDINPSKLEQCGLVIPRQSEGYYDRYRSRIIIPIHDIHGNIIGIRRTHLSGQRRGSKISQQSGDITLFKIDATIRILFFERTYPGTKFAILVEGYFDMIMPFQAGHNNIVASLGTSLTENQARFFEDIQIEVVVFTIRILQENRQHLERFRSC